jgi:serine/threonine protein kinase
MRASFLLCSISAYKALLCRLAHQAAIGVNALHLNMSCIVHRDIKSLNFLVSHDLSVLKLIDFGMAKVIASSQATPTMPQKQGNLARV